MPFPVKALKLLLHDLQTGGEAASMGFSAKDVSEVASDDGVRAFPFSDIFICLGLVSLLSSFTLLPSSHVSYTISRPSLRIFHSGTVHPHGRPAMSHVIGHHAAAHRGPPPHIVTHIISPSNIPPTLFPPLRSPMTRIC